MYKQYFGFLEAPFSITPDPNFFYNNPVYAEALANLRYGIEAKRGFIVITGEVGTGKTTLLRKLMRELHNSIHFAFIYNTDLSFNELLRAILIDLGLATDGKDRLAMIDELNGYLLEQLEKRDIVCLLIDEVQNLSDESLEGLRLLSNLETDREKLLQIVLMGQPELNARLDQANLRQLKQRIAIQCELAPISDEEVGAYIKFRLRTAGYEGENLFSREAVQKIAFYSKGIPRLINVICDNALVIAYAASHKSISGNIITEVAKDLRLESQTQYAGAKNPLNAAVADDQRGTAVREASHQEYHANKKRVLIFGVRTLLAISAFIVIVSVINARSFIALVARSIDLFKSNLNEPFVFVAPPPPDGLSQRAVAEVNVAEPQKQQDEPKSTSDRLVIQYGSTIYEIAIDHYGTNVLLGMDLIKELNPEIKNLNWVAAGQELLLPALAPETLIRQNADGSYRLIVSSFLNRTEAEAFGRRISREGYGFIITARRASNDLVLHRVEIDGLKNIEEAIQAWETGLKNEWFTFPGNRANGNPRGQRNTDRKGVRRY